MTTPENENTRSNPVVSSDAASASQPSTFVLSPGAVAPDQKAVVPDTKAKKSLVVIGSLLVVLFVAGIVASRWVGNTSKEVGTPTTTGTSATQTEVTKTTTTKNFPSDTLLTAVLGTGAALIVVGLLYYRLSVIKLPGGVELDLAEKKAIDDGVKAKVDEGKVKPAAATAVAVQATELAKGEKAKQGVITLSQSTITEVVDKSAEEWGTGGWE